MSAARRKGNALELEVARRLHELDGRDQRLAVLESSGGRLGGTYALQIDIASKHVAAECKNREDNPARLWEWLDGLNLAVDRLRNRLGDTASKLPVVVLKRNRRRALVVLDFEDFARLLDCARSYDVRLSCGEPDEVQP